jgi:hypothetical protein
MRRLVQEKLPLSWLRSENSNKTFSQLPAAIWVMEQLGAAGLKTVPKSTALSDVCKLQNFQSPPFENELLLRKFGQGEDCAKNQQAVVSKWSNRKFLKR